MRAHFTKRPKRAEGMSEEWRAVVGFEGIYDVSDLGRIRSLRFINGVTDKLRVSPLIRKPVTVNGYLHIRLSSREKGRIQRGLHCVVLEAFVGPCPEGHECAHLDGNRVNPRLENLKWVTCKENQFHRIAHGTACFGSKNPRAKISEATALEIIKLKNRGLTPTAIGRQLGVTRRIAQSCGRDSWKWLARQYTLVDANREEEQVTRMFDYLMGGSTEGPKQ